MKPYDRNYRDALSSTIYFIAFLIVSALGRINKKGKDRIAGNLSGYHLAYRMSYVRSLWLTNYGEFSRDFGRLTDAVNSAS